MPHTLLLADDSVTIQRVIELTFADEDIKVVAVSDGDQAIERLKGAAPDIVLADIGMPGKNGYEVAQYIRESPKLSHIPVVLLTGAFEPVDQARAAQAGCDAVLAKPFEPQLVIGRVKDLLSKRRSADSGTDPGDVPTAAPPASVASVAASAPAASLPAEPAALDEYFDRLDAAFSNLSAPPASASPMPEPPPAAAAAPAADASADVQAEIEWLSTPAAPDVPAATWEPPTPAAENVPADFPVTFASPEPQVPDLASEEADAALLQQFADATLEMTSVAAAEFEPAPVDVDAQPAEPSAPISLPIANASVTVAPVIAAPVAPPPADAPVALAPVAPVECAAVAPVLAPVAPVAAAPEAPSPETPAPAAPEKIAATRESSAPVAPVPAVPVSQMPSVGDAFAALLAAESESDAPAALWPAVAQPPPVPAITDDIIEDVVARVMARLSDNAVREAAAEIVSRIAERLVAEEIERIKASVK